MEEEKSGRSIATKDGQTAIIGGVPWNKKRTLETKKVRERVLQVKNMSPGTS